MRRLAGAFPERTVHVTDLPYRLASPALHVRDGIGSLTFDGTTPRLRGRGC